MKNFLLALFIIFLGGTLIISCTKTDLNNSALASQNLSSTKKVVPDVPNCGTGYHWDFYLGKCVPDCPPGFHNDSLTGACAINGGSGTIDIITNPNNPNDYMGAQHNNGVASILPNINLYSPTLDSDVLVKVKTFDVSLGYNSDSAQSFYNRMVALGDLPFSKEPELDSLGNKLYSQGLISSSANSYVQQIYSTANTYLNVDNPTIALYNTFANEMISLENEIKSDNTISANERATLLSSCAIGRYSAAYWGNYFNNPNPSYVVKPLLLQRLKRWLRVVACDIGGGIVGIVAGPVGIITGAVGGSIVADASL